MRKLKRILMFLLMTASLVSSLNISSFALTSGDYEYRFMQITDTLLSDEYIVITKYLGNRASVDIPNTIDGYYVYGIDHFAFANNSTITDIRIPENTLGIAGDAFSGCVNLRGFTVNSKNTTCSSDNGVLYNKSKTRLVCCPGTRSSVTILPTVTEIGDFAFSFCDKIAYLNIPQGVTYIGDSAFQDCRGLTDIIIPSSVNKIGELCFMNCSSLRTITFRSPSTVFETDVVLSDLMEMIPSSTKIIGYAPSTAKDYAKQFNRTFELITASKTATPTGSTVLINGSKVAFDAYTIDDSNYFKLRDLAMVIDGTEKQFEVGWSSANNAINLQTGKAYTAVGGELVKSGNTSGKTANPTTSSIYLNGAQNPSLRIPSVTIITSSFVISAV